MLKTTTLLNKKKKKKNRRSGISCPAVTSAHFGCSLGCPTPTASGHDGMAVVRPLAPQVASRLRAGPAAVDVVQCVEELVLNAIDAEAKRIRVEVSGRQQ